MYRVATCLSPIIMFMQITHSVFIDKCTLFKIPYWSRLEHLYNALLLKTYPKYEKAYYARECSEDLVHVGYAFSQGDLQPG